MKMPELIQRLERCPVIPAVRDDQWEAALQSPSEVVFHLGAGLLTVRQRAEEAKAAGKSLFVHIDLADGIGKDREGIQYLAQCGVDGIISTRGQLIRLARDLGLLTVQRFFALDSQGMDSAREMLRNTDPHLVEVMPGVIPKVIARFSAGGAMVIAGGLIETKQEVTAALGSGAAAISTGSQELWYV